MTDALPAGATFVSASPGCTLVSATVRCVLGTLANGAHPTITINVKWTVSGAVYDSASVGSDQINSAPAAQQTLAFGVPPTYSSDGPVPPWAYVLLALSMGLIARRRLVPAAVRPPR
jgi:hypothetical protein